MKDVAEYSGDKFERLREAVKELYYAAHWTPDRECDDAALWTAVRDAAGLEPGGAPKPEGE